MSSGIDPSGELLTGPDVGFGTIHNILVGKSAIAGLLTRPGPPAYSASTDVASPKLAPKSRLVALRTDASTKAGITQKAGSDKAAKPSTGTGSGKMSAARSHVGARPKPV